MYGPTDVDKAAYTAGVTDKELPIEGAPLAQMDAYFGALRAIDDQRVETVHARQKELLNTRGLSKEEPSKAGLRVGARPPATARAWRVHGAAP
ncbi:hypothetical protein KFE25_006469 [Diacronema lutheri]|uniref:Uncharacterized protein n=1 Tax=Diacronema lutheri TaxID=2081491 RepID=A0A8J5Y2E8_DIALT|nr:hypothetical protein KFE25_006469 [Diacronema lutheri]